MRCISILLLAGLNTVVCAQITEPPPDSLLDAGHCLAAADRDWLDVVRENPYQLDLGYVSGEKDSGSAPLYLVEFTTPTHTEGFAFAFLSRGKEIHRQLLLEYRTRFRQSDDGTQRVNLVDPPLGGVGTQDDVLAAIRQVGFHTWSVPVAALKSHSSSVRCDTAQAMM